MEERKEEGKKKVAETERAEERKKKKERSKERKKEAIYLLETTTCIYSKKITFVHIPLTVPNKISLPTISYVFGYLSNLQLELIRV